MSRYKHTLYVKRASSSNTLNEDGDFVARPNTRANIGLCRAEPSSARNSLVVDGQQVNYSWKIYLPEIHGNLSVGETIQVVDQFQTLRAEGVVIHIINDGKNVKIWV